MTKSLENPSNIKNVYEEFQNAVKKINTNQRTDLALKTMIKICRCLEKVEWKTEVEVHDLITLTCQLCEDIFELTDAEYRKYVAAICNIHRSVVKKKCTMIESINLLRHVFEKSTLKLTSDQSKNYFIMLVDFFQVYNAEKVKDEHMKPIMGMIFQYIRVIDMLAMENFIWLMRKCEIIFDKKPQELNIVYKNIFIDLIDNEKMIKNTSKLESNMVFKKLLYFFTLLHTNVVKCDDSKDSFILYFMLCSKLLQSNEITNSMLREIAAIVPIFTLPVEKLHSDSCHALSNFVYKLFSLRDCQRSEILEEICLTLKKILCTTLSNWISVPDELWKKHISIDLQRNVLQLVTAIVKVMNKSGTQTVQCNNCNFKSAIHDSLSLSSYGGAFCVKSAKCGLDVSSLFECVECIMIELTNGVKLLQSNGCSNWKAFWKKIENGHHNDSILLYSNKKYEYSLKMFTMYIQNFVRVLSWNMNEADLINLAKAYYNMAICQSDLQLGYSALISCYTSLAIQVAVKTNLSLKDLPHCQLIIQVKAKIHSQIQSTKISESDLLGEVNHNRTNEELQMLNIWAACREFSSDKKNDIFNIVFASIKFENLLLSELELYLNQWPATNCIAGICGALQELLDFSTSTNYLPPFIGTLALDAVIVSCGKAVTLIIKHSVKLTHTKIIDMIAATKNSLQELLKDSQSYTSSAVSKIFVELLWANTLYALGLCKMYEKRRLGIQNPLVETAPKTPLAPHHPNIHPDDVCDVTPAHQYLTLQVEDEILENMCKATDAWRNALLKIDSSSELKRDKEMMMYIWMTCDITEMCMQVFALYESEYSILAADITYFLATLSENIICSLRSVAFLLEKALKYLMVPNDIIMKTNIIVYKILSRDDVKPESAVLIDACLEYLLNLSLYYYNSGMIHQAGIILSSVANRILNLYVDKSEKANESGRKIEDIKISYVKMLQVQWHFISNCQDKSIKNKMFGILSCHINANSECGDIVKFYEHNRGRPAILSQRMWLETAYKAGEIALSLGLVRRARSLLRPPLSVAQRLLLSRRASDFLILLAQADLIAERHDDCMVKIEGVKYILGEHNTQRNKKTIDGGREKVFCEDKTKVKKFEGKTHKNFEMVLDVPQHDKNDASLSGSPTFAPSPFVFPSFVSHTRECRCFKCISVTIYILYIKFIKLQAQLQFRNGETKVTESFYEGGMKCIKYLFSKFDHIDWKLFFSLQDDLSICKFNNERKHEMIRAECNFLNDAVIYYITEDDMDAARSLNTKILETVSKEADLKNDHFLLSTAEEHSLYLSQLDVMEKYSQTSAQLDIMDNIQKDLASKLIITPEKKPRQGFNFTTPSDKKFLAINRVKRNIENVSPTLKKDKVNLVPPSIKFSLEEADDEDFSKIDSKELFEERTPAPKLRDPKIDVDLRVSRSHVKKIVEKNDKVETGKKLIAKNPSTSHDCPAITVLFNEKSQPKVYANKAARKNIKVTLSPNNVLIESNHVKIKNDAINSEKYLTKNTGENEKKPKSTPKTVAESIGTSTSRIKKSTKETASKPVATRQSARKRL